MAASPDFPAGDVESRPWIRPEDKMLIIDRLDTTLQFMASGGVATAIIDAIGKAHAVHMSLGVGLALGFGIGPVMWLGTQIINATIMKIFQVCFPLKYAVWEEYQHKLNSQIIARKRHPVGSDMYNQINSRIDELKSKFQEENGKRITYGDVAWIQGAVLWFSFLSTCVAAFFILNAAVGSITILPFIGAIVFTLLFLLAIPKPSNVITYFKAIVHPTPEEAMIPLSRRVLGKRPERSEADQQSSNIDADFYEFE